MRISDTLKKKLKGQVPGSALEEWLGDNEVLEENIALLERHLEDVGSMPKLFFSNPMFWTDGGVVEAAKNGLDLERVAEILDSYKILGPFLDNEADIGWAELGEIAKAGGDPYAFADAGFWQANELQVIVGMAGSGISYPKLFEALTTNPVIAAGVQGLAFWGEPKIGLIEDVVKGKEDFHVLGQYI